MSILQNKEVEKSVASVSPAAPLQMHPDNQAPSPQEVLTQLLQIAGSEEAVDQYLTKARNRFIFYFLSWQVVFLSLCHLATRYPALLLLPCAAFVVGLVGLVIPGLEWSSANHCHSFHKHVKWGIAQIESHDAQPLRALLSVLSVTPYKFRSILLPTITELLGEVQSEEAHRLIDAHQGKLLRHAIQSILTQPSDVEADFCVVAMKVLAFSGDPKAAYTLRQKTRRETDRLNARVVHDAAQECLPLLEENVMRYRATRRTLRELFSTKKETPAIIALQDSYLNALSPKHAREVLVDFFQEEERRQSQLELVRLFVQLALFCTCPFLFMRKENPFLFSVLYVGVAFTMSRLSFVTFRKKALAQVATRLCYYSDKTTTGILLDALRRGYLKDDSISLLANLLAQFTSADVALLNEEQRHYLRKTLSLSHTYSKYVTSATRYSAPFLVAAIHALTVIGDTKVLSLREKTARQHPLTPVREAAGRSLARR